MSRPYFYHYAATFSRSHNLAQSIAHKELGKAGFEVSSPLKDWEHFGSNADTLVLVTNVPLSEKKTYTHVLATSNSQDSAKKWAADLMQAIKDSKAVLFD